MSGLWNLQTLWFVLVCVLWIGFMFLEGFDFGVGMLLRFVGKSPEERRAVIHTIGPVWDGNEVWLLTAGGATFAAFPNWYASMFSGFYLALFLVLFGLIIRGVSFEFWGKVESPRWRSVWEWAMAVGSFLPALLVGVAFANLIRGISLDPAGQLHRQLLGPAEPLRTPGRGRDAAALPCPRRELPAAAHRRTDQGRARRHSGAS